MELFDSFTCPCASKFKIEWRFLFYRSMKSIFFPFRLPVESEGFQTLWAVSFLFVFSIQKASDRYNSNWPDISKSPITVYVHLSFLQDMAIYLVVVQNSRKKINLIGFINFYTEHNTFAEASGRHWGSQPFDHVGILHTTENPALGTSAHCRPLGTSGHYGNGVCKRHVGKQCSLEHG